MVQPREQVGGQVVPSCPKYVQRKCPKKVSKKVSKKLTFGEKFGEEFLCIWEMIHNADFKVVEFDHLRGDRRGYTTNGQGNSLSVSVTIRSLAFNFQFSTFNFQLVTGPRPLEQATRLQRRCSEECAKHRDDEADYFRDHFLLLIFHSSLHFKF